MRDLSERFREALRAVCPGVARIGDTRRPFETAVFAPDPAATDEQREAAQKALDLFDWSDEAQQRWVFGRASADAVKWVAGSPDPVAIAIRVLLRDLYTALNDLRELHDLERVQEPAVAARLVALTNLGGGMPIQLGG